MTSMTGHHYGPTLKISTKLISYCADMLTNRTIDPVKATPQQHNGEGDTTMMRWQRQPCNDKMTRRRRQHHDNTMAKATLRHRNGEVNTVMTRQQRQPRNDAMAKVISQ